MKFGRRSCRSFEKLCRNRISGDEFLLRALPFLTMFELKREELDALFRLT